MSVVYIKKSEPQTELAEMQRLALDGIGSALLYLEAVALKNGLNASAVGLRFAQYMCMHQGDTERKPDNLAAEAADAFVKLGNDFTI